MSRLITWVCQTPRRLTGSLAVPILLLLVTGSIWSGNRGSNDNSLGSGPVAAVNAQVPDAAPFVTAAVRFVNVWGKLAPGQSPDEWHAAVRALATPELGNVLDHTDTQGLPEAKVSGRPSVLDVTATDAIVEVPMSDGRTVLVTVVAQDGQSWLARDIQPHAGNN